MWKPAKKQPQSRSLDLGLIGAAGWIARVHLATMREAGHRLVIAMDPSDAGIAILDEFFPEADFVRSEEEFAQALQQRRAAGRPLDYVSICSPDWLHRPHIELSLGQGVPAICEKPLVRLPEELDRLDELEQATGCRIHPINQHRYNPAVRDLRRIIERARGRRVEIEISYVTSRGPWYLHSWRGDPDKAGGLAMDIGIHFFDLLIWLFGEVEQSEVHLSAPRRMAGYLRCDLADVRWFLSVDEADLPEESRSSGIRHLRSFRFDGREIDLTKRMRELHRVSYDEISAGRGLSVADVRPGLELAHRIQTAGVVQSGEHAHPFVRGEGLVR